MISVVKRLPLVFYIILLTVVEKHYWSLCIKSPLIFSQHLLWKILKTDIERIIWYMIFPRESKIVNNFSFLLICIFLYWFIYYWCILNVFSFNEENENIFMVPCWILVMITQVRFKVSHDSKYLWFFIQETRIVSQARNTYPKASFRYSELPRQ